jgi:hypothetical protein
MRQSWVGGFALVSASVALSIAFLGTASAAGKVGHLDSISGPNGVNVSATSAAIVGETQGTLDDCAANHVCTVGETDLRRVVLSTPKTIDARAAFGTVAAGCNSGDYDVVFHWKDQATSGEVGSGLAAALAADFVKGSGIRHIDCVVHVIVVPPTESVPAPS